MIDSILKVLDGRADAAERALVDAWRRCSDEHDEEFLAMQQVWEMTSGTRRPLAHPPRPSASRLLHDRSSRGRPHFPGFSLRHPSSDIGWRRSTAAALALLAIGLGAGHFLFSQPVGEVETTEFVTDGGARGIAHLTDGSVIRLAPGARLRVSLDRNRRDVWLDGRAFFVVAPDERPFTVRTKDGEAMALGTRFDLDATGEELQLVVVEGRVALSGDGGEIEVGAGEVSRVSLGFPTPAERVEDAGELVDWIGSFLVFAEAPLKEVAREIEERYGMRIVLLDETLSKRTVTAWFTDEHVEDIMETICAISGAHCIIGDQITSIEP